MSDWDDDADADSWESYFAGGESFDQEDEGEVDERSAEAVFADVVSSDEPDDDDLGEAERVADPPPESNQTNETLEDAATRLESVGRATTNKLQEAEHEFNSLNLGLEVWLTGTAAALARSVRKEPDESTTWRVAQLGYGPIDAGWGLLVRVLSSSDTLRLAGPVTPVRRGPLLRCSRRIQARALRLVPILRAALRDSAAKEADRIERDLDQ